jgi:Proteasome subunit
MDVVDSLVFVFSFGRNVISGVAGLTADANSLINYARTAAQRHLLSYNEDIPVELLAQRLCDMKQGYTQFGGISAILLFFCPLLRPDAMTQASDRLVFRFSTLDTTSTTNSSSIILTLQATIRAGKRRVLVPTTARRKVC